MCRCGRHSLALGLPVRSVRRCRFQDRSRFSRDVTVVQRARFATGDPLGSDDPFGRRDVRKLRVRAADRDDITDRRDARHARAVNRVDRDVAPLELNPQLLGPRDPLSPGPGRSRPTDSRLAEAAPLTHPTEQRVECDPGVEVGPRALVTLALVRRGNPLLPKRPFRARLKPPHLLSGAKRGSGWRLVTSVTNQFKNNTNSTPTAPLPSIHQRHRGAFGTQADRFITRDNSLCGR